MFGENLFWKNKKKEENEDEDFQLLYYLGYFVKSGIDGVPNPSLLQICRWHYSLGSDIAFIYR